MRVNVVIAWMVLVSSCAPVMESSAPPAARVPDAVSKVALAGPGASTAPARPLESPRATSGTIAGIAFEGVVFDSRSHRLVVADQAGGPGSRFADAAGAGRSRGGLAATNAGFFTPEGEPLGLVVSEGQRSGAWNAASSLGSGIWHEDFAGQSAITRRAHLGKPTASAMRELIQAGPMLVANGRSVSGLDATKHSIRTFVLWDGGTRWWLGRASACTLAGLAAALSHGQPAGWPVRDALNLDGGRSSDLWISGSVASGPLTRRAPWNRPVRNFLVLLTR